MLLPWYRPVSEPKTPVEYPPPNIIAPLLNARVTERARLKVGEEHVIHVSDLMRISGSDEFCAREHVLHSRNNREYSSRTLSPGRLLLFEYGHAVHEHVRNRFIRNSPYSKFMWGRWACRCYSPRTKQGLCITGYRPSLNFASACKICGTKPFRYLEFEIYLPQYMLVGHPDMLLRWNGVFMVYEIKTIERQDVEFDTMTAPLGDHVLQATIYNWMLREAGNSVFSSMRFLYADRAITKKLWSGTVYKEFERHMPPEGRLRPFLEKAASVKRAIHDKGALPPRICNAVECARAKNCAVAVQCFSLREGT